jgi:hypothetical protein
MTVICVVCSTPTLRGPVNADIVRHLSLRKIAERHKLSVRSVQRHLKHLPQLLETETPAAVPSVYVGSVTYNINLLVFAPEEGAAGEEYGGGGA